MIQLNIIEKIKYKFSKIKQFLNEKTIRLWCAIEAITLGYGGITAVHKATNVSIRTIQRGITQYKNGDFCANNRIRKIGGGRKNILITDEIKTIVSEETYGTPMNNKIWKNISLRKIYEIIDKKISHTTIGKLLKKENYSLQQNKKIIGSVNNNPNRNIQFNIINTSIKNAAIKNEPFISVDTKKKELIGNFKNNGKIYRNKNNPIKVSDHDFPHLSVGKAIPYGIYDVNKNKGFVNVGTNKDTSKFAVNSIRKWLNIVGKKYYSNIKNLHISADAGGSNGYRVRLWKYELQKLANEYKINIYVHHYPPGTSKYNKIEHRMFAYISKNWAGHPLTNYDTVLNFIKNTTTTTGLTIDCEIDNEEYKTKLKINKKQFKSINKQKFDITNTNNDLENWNYIICSNN